MAAYRADIEIGVRGARSLEQLRSSINQTARAVDSLNDVVSARGSLVQNIQSYTNNLNRAAQSLKLVGAGTEAETKAVREYVRALGEANTARARQNSLVAQEIANQRRITPSNAGYGQQGPALPPALIRGQQIQQNWNRFFTDAAQVAQELQSASAAKEINIKTSWNRFFTDAAQVAQELQSASAAKEINIKTSWNRFFTQAQEIAVELNVQAQKTAAAIRSSEGLASAGARQRLAGEAARRQLIQNAGFGVQGPALPPSSGGGSARGGRGIGGRLGGAISGSIIGGAFPLLFGQGGGAAAGGAIGGLVGGLAGPGGSFAGSLLGTLLGDIASRGQAVKQLAEDIGFSAQQTKQLSDAFKVANTDVEKFTAVIQNIRGVGLEIEDQAKAIQLVTRLTELYGGSFEKTGNAITSALESGKVTQATLNQLTSQGINIQQALADKYGVSRSALLQMAKDGKISVQSLIDTLVDLGNKPGEVAKQTQTASQQFQSAIQNLTNIVGPELQRLGKLFLEFGTTALNALNSVLIRLGQAGKAIENAVAGETLKNAQTQFRRDAALLKQLYATPKARRTAQQVQQITALENLQQGRMQVINAAKPAAPPKPLETFPAPSQAAAASDKASDKAAKDAERLAQQRQKQLEVAARMAVLTEGELQKSVAVTEQEKLNTEYAQQRMERMVKYETLYKEALSSAEIEYLLMAQSNEILAENVNYQKDLLDIAIAQSEVINKADPLASAQQDLELLAAKIQGKEKEYLVQKQINDLIKQGATPEDAQGLILTIQDLEKQNKAIETQKQLWADIYTTVAGEIQNAITGLIKGTAQWGDVLSSILGSLGNLFLNAAFNSLGGALKLPGFASGGFVTRPTTAVVGEGGEPEYVIPASKMRTAMGRYSAGARGSSVVSGDGVQVAGNGASVATMEPIDVRYSIERINNVDYVTADQFQRGMAQAAQQGAVQGERRAMRSLKNSPATRRGVGI